MSCALHLLNVMSMQTFYQSVLHLGNVFTHGRMFVGMTCWRTSEGAPMRQPTSPRVGQAGALRWTCLIFAWISTRPEFLARQPSHTPLAR